MSENSEDNNLLSFIASSVETMRDQVETMRDQMVTKQDLAQMVTKQDLAQLETRLNEKIDTQGTIIRGDIEQVQLRLGNIERTFTARVSKIEAEVSRLRSVLYILIKDKPDLLRLLGPKEL